MTRCIEEAEIRSYVVEELGDPTLITTEIDSISYYHVNL